MPSGGDYAKLSDAVAYLQANCATLTAPVVITISGSWGSADTTAVTISGITTSSSNTITITTTGSARHDGRAASVSGRSNYILGNISGNISGINIADYVSYITIDGLELYNIKASFTAFQNGISIPRLGTGNVIKNNIIHSIGKPETNANGNAIRLNGIEAAQGVTIFNNIIYDIARAGIANSDHSTNKIYNNTIYNYNVSNTSSLGILATAGEVKNNVVVSGATGGGCYSVTGVTTATNGSSDTTGTAGLQNLTTSVFVSTSDLHLSGTAVDNGTDLGSPYNVDIIGTTRPQGSAWDIGAFEYVNTVTKGNSLIRGGSLIQGGSTIK
jgi:hypothetical protein